MRRSTLLVLAAFAIGALWPAIARAQGNPLASCKYSLVEREQFSYPLVAGSDTVHEGRLSGRVRVICDDMTLQAEEIHWREDSDKVYASGDVFFQQLGTQISAEKAEMDRQTHLGTFYQASGWLELQSEKPDKTLFGTQEPYAVFQGDKLEKIGDKLYELTHGSFTTCRQPTPRWEMTASTVILATGSHATLKNMVLRVKDVPIFYLPALYYPINHEDRATGFLLPNYGASTVKGLSLSNAFFWAIDRSQDATFYYDYFAKAGQGLGSEYRYAADAGSQGNGRIYMLDEHEQKEGDTVVRPAHRSFDIRGNINQALTRTVRLTGHINYFTDITTQQLYQQNIYDLSQRTRSYGASVSAVSGRFRFIGQYDQTDIFTGHVGVAGGHGPASAVFRSRKNRSADRRYTSARQPTAASSSVRTTSTIRRRIEVSGGSTAHRESAYLSAISPALTVTAAVSWRYTFWTNSLEPGLGQVPESISRQIADLQMRVVGPVFSRIWHTPKNHYADGFKHLIEPSMTIDRLSAFKDAERIVQLDGTDTIVTGTTTLNYGITNRIMAKRRTGAAPGVALQPGIRPGDSDRGHQADVLHELARRQIRPGLSVVLFQLLFVSPAAEPVLAGPAVGDGPPDRYDQRTISNGVRHQVQSRPDVHRVRYGQLSRWRRLLPAGPSGR